MRHPGFGVCVLLLPATFPKGLSKETQTTVPVAVSAQNYRRGMDAPLKNATM